VKSIRWCPGNTSIHRIVLEHPCFGFHLMGSTQPSFVTQHTSDSYCHLTIFNSVVITKFHWLSNWTIIWHVDPLLGKGRETRKCSIAIAKLLLRKQASFDCNDRRQQYWKRCFLRGPCREVGEMLGFSRCELLLLEAGNRGRGQFGDPQQGEHPPLKAATKHRQWRRDCGH
jgi:hypothetical protein